MIDDTKIQSYVKDGRYTISGRCPNCNSQIAIHVSTDLYRPRTRQLDPKTKEEIVLLLGTMRDFHIAKKFGVSASYVRNERIRRNIPNYSVVNDEPLWAKVDPLLPNHRDVAICKLTGVSAMFISRRRAKLGLPRPQKYQTLENKKRVFLLHDQGFDMAAIGRALRFSRQYVEQVLIGERPA